jgi:hypothetical protein
LKGCFFTTLFFIDIFEIMNPSEVYILKQPEP